MLGIFGEQVEETLLQPLKDNQHKFSEKNTPAIFHNFKS